MPLRHRRGWLTIFRLGQGEVCVVGLANRKTAGLLGCDEVVDVGAKLSGGQLERSGRHRWIGAVVVFKEYEAVDFRSVKDLLFAVLIDVYALCGCTRCAQKEKEQQECYGLKSFFHFRMNLDDCCWFFTM